MLLICYPRCSTCAKAEKWLRAQGLAYDYRDIQKQRPTADELKGWRAESGLDIGRFWNTSGMAYRALGIAARRPAMSEEEQFALLATDGLLVKRPILIGDDFILTGFREAEWRRALRL